jgi:protocatechuate 3,4-dioxygenase beta subunit
MRIGWIWIVWAGMAQAQAPPPPYAAIGGVVLNDVTGTPMERAAITLSTLDDTPLEALTFTESNGRFGFTDIPPGKYQLHADLDGFQRVWFGASTPARPPGTLKLAAGDFRYGITFRLRPLGSISGVVLDPDGDPLVSAQIRLLRSTWERLKPAYSYIRVAGTDELGRYHLENLVPGQYMLMASQPNVQALTIQPEAASQTAAQAAQKKMYAVQFYPDAASLAGAAPVQVTEGEEIEGIDFHLSTRAAAALRGKIALPGGVPNVIPNGVPNGAAGDAAANQNVQISVFPQDIPMAGFQFAASHGNAFPPNYDFEIPNLIAGPYMVAASLSAAGRDYRSVERIELPAGGAEITLHPDRAIDLSGRVDFEGGPQPGGPVRVALIPGGFPPGRSRIRTEAQPDGSFVLANVDAGIWDIHVEPVPPGGYVKAMRLGDRDVLTEDMNIDPGTREALHIVVSARGAVVSGTVKVPEGVARSARAAVLLAPYGKYAQVLSFYRRASADDAGHFEIKGVTPGRYKVFAFEELDAAAYEDPGFLKSFDGFSEAFDLAEGARADRQIQLILAGTEGRGK